MSMRVVAENYAQALYSLARDEALDTKVLEELEVLRDVFSKEADYLRLLGSCNISKDERCAVLDDAFRNKVHIYVLNFLKLLTEKGRIRLFPDCVKAYREQYNIDHGIVSVLAVTATPLTDDQFARLQAKLEKMIGKKVLLNNRIDASCIGGVRLDYDGMRMDGTVKNRLDTVAAMLKNTVL